MAWYSFITDWVQNVIDGALSWVTDAIDDAWTWLTDGVAALTDKVNLFMDTIADKVSAFLQPVKDWVIQTVLNITENIRVWKYRFSLEFSKWMDNPILFWLTIAGVVALVIVSPELSKLITGSQLWTKATVIFDVVKKGLGTLLDRLKFIQLNTVNKIFLLVNPKYKAYWSELDQAFMGMAEQIEVGVGTLNNITSSVRGLYYATYSLLGIDSDTIEAKFYDDSTLFWSNAQKHWERYVRNPNLIFDDIQAELIYPILDEQAQLGVQRAANDLAVAQRLDDIVLDLNKVRIAFNDLLNSLPSDLRTMITDKIGAFVDQVNDFFTTTVMPFMDRVDIALGVIDTTLNEMNDSIYANAIRKPTPGDQFTAVLFDGSLDIESKRKMMSQIFGRILSGDIDDTAEGTTRMVMVNHREKGDMPPTTKESNPEPFVPLFNLDYSAIVRSAEPWFVGEY